MKKLFAIALCSLPLAMAPAVYAQTTPSGNTDGSSTAAPGAGTSSTGNGAAAGNNSMGATGTAANPAGGADNNAMAASGSDWSVKDGLIGKTVYNENNDKVGNITDVTVSSDGKMTAFVVGAGGFLGMGEHNVAIPFDRITKSGDKFTLAGYTKDQLKAMPAYKSRTSGAPMTSDRLSNPSSSSTATPPGTTTTR